MACLKQWQGPQTVNHYNFWLSKYETCHELASYYLLNQILVQKIQHLGFTQELEHKLCIILYFAMLS